MSRQPNIRWRASDVDKLERTINAFNQRLYRQQKKNPDSADALPTRQNAKLAMTDIQTRSDFNRYIAKLERFRGAEKYQVNPQVNATQWAIDELKIADRIYKAKQTKRQKKLEETPVTIANQPTGVTRAEMGDIKEHDKKPPKHDIEKMTPTEFQMAVKMMDAKLHSSYDAERMKRLKENYIKGLIRVGVSDQVQQIVSSVPLEKFVQLVDTDEVGSIDFIYSPEELDVIESYLHDLWYDHATLDKYGIPVNVDEIDIENIAETVAYENYLMQFADDETRAKVGMSHKKLSPAEKARRKEERRRNRERQKRNGK